MTLEQQLHALVRDHDLTSLSITVYASSDVPDRIGVSAQGGGKCAFDVQGAAGTVQARIASALTALAEKRAAVVDVPELAPMAEAA